MPTASRASDMGDEYCDEHSGHCARLDALEKTALKTEKAIEKLQATMNKWGGVIAGIAAAPLILKLLEIFAPAAQAFGGN